MLSWKYDGKNHTVSTFKDAYFQPFSSSVGVDVAKLSVWSKWNERQCMLSIHYEREEGMRFAVFSAVTF